MASVWIRAAEMRVRISEHVVVRELGGEAVLLHLGTGIYFGLDTVGARIWQLLAGQGDTEAVYAQLLGEYEVDAVRLRADLDALVEQLIAEQLLFPADSP